MFSKSCEYAIRAVLYIVAHSDEHHKAGIEAIAREIGSPRHFTAKLLQTLVKAEIVSSVKGPNGGFYIAGDNQDIPLLNIVEAIEGSGKFKSCILGLQKCSEIHPCPMHHHYKEIRDRLIAILTKQNIGQMARELQQGHVFVKSEK